MEHNGLQFPVTPQHSCLGRCGYERAPVGCRCDPECNLFNDCCVDYNDTCNSVQKEFGTLDPTMFTCITLKDTSYIELSSVLLVASCPHDFKELNLRMRCENSSNDLASTDVVKGWPVFDQHGNNFKNIYCAICNGYDFSSLQPWNVNYQLLYDKVSSSNLPVSDECKTEKSLGEVGRRLRFCYPSLISQCPPSYANTSLSTACLAYSANICPKSSKTREKFRNFHCAACNGYNDVEDLPACSPAAGLFGNPTYLQRIWTFAENSRKLEENENKGICSGDNHVFDPYSQMCRSVSCQSYSSTDNGSECVFRHKVVANGTDGLCCENEQTWIMFKISDPGRSNLHAEIIKCFINLLFPDENVVSWSKYQYLGVDSGYMMLKTNDSVCSQAKNMDYLFVESSAALNSCGIDNIHFQYMCTKFPASGECDGLWFTGNATDFARIDGTEVLDVFAYGDQFIVPQLVLHKMSFTLSEGGTSFAKEDAVFMCGKEIRLPQCPAMTLYAGDYNVTQNHYNRTTVSIATIILEESHVTILPDGQLLMCVSKNIVTSGDVFSYSGLLDTVNMMGTSASLISLCFLLGIHGMYSKLRNFHGKCLMSSAVALFWAQFLPMLSAKIFIPHGLCVFLAVVAHYAWLVTFTWMVIIGGNFFHMLILRPMQSREVRESTYMFRFVLPILGWCQPLIIIAVCISLHYLQLDNVYFEYGTSSPCWISGPTANLISFGIPVASYLGINLFLFSWIIIALCRRQRRSRSLRNRRTDTVELQDAVLCMKVN